MTEKSSTVPPIQVREDSPVWRAQAGIPYEVSVLAKRERQLAESQRLAHLGSWEWDIVADKITWSDELYRIFGLQPEQFGGSYQALVEYVHPDDRERLKNGVEQARLDARSFSIRHRIVRADGAVRTMQAWGDVATDEQGRVVRMVGTAQDITEQAQLDELLRESEQRYRTLAEVAQDMIFIVGRDDTIQYANDCAARQLGQEPKALIGQRRTRLFPPAVAERQSKNLQQVFDSRQPLYVEHEAGFGQPGLWVGTVLTPICDADGTVRAVLGIARDITGRKRAEEALRESEERFSRLLESAFDGVAITEQGRFLEVSPGFAAMFGYEPPEMAGRSVATVVAPDCVAEVLEKIRTDFEKPYESVCVRKDGVRFPVEVCGKTISYHGRRARITAVRDISERRRAEEQLRLHSQLLSNLSEGVQMTRSADGVIEYTNPRFNEMFGYGPGELIGQPVSLLNASGEQSPTEVADQITASLKTKGSWRGDVLNARKDGTTFWSHAKVSTLRHPLYGEIWLTVQEDITARKRAEEALRRSHEELKATWDALPDLFFEVDRESRIYSFRATHPELLYLPPEAFLGKLMTELLPGDAAQVIASAVAEAAQNGRHTGAVYSLNLPGGRRWFELSIAAKGDHRAPQARYVVLARDITERKQMEDALRESEERYRLMVETIPLLAWRTDPEGLTTDCNERWREYTGQTHAEARGKGWMRALHPDDLQPTMRWLRDAVAAGEFYQIEYRLRRGLGDQYRWHLARAMPVKDTDGKILCWFGCAADVDDQKRAEAALRRQSEELEQQVQERTAALRESEARYRTLVELAPDPIGVIVDGRVAFANQQGADLIGATCPDQLIGRPIEQFIPRTDLKTVRGLLDGLRRRGGILPMTEVRLVRLNGTIVDVEVAANAITYRQMPAVQLIGRDITERKRMEQALAEVREREQQRIAQDLHDSLGQQLTGIAFLCKALQQKLTKKSRAAAANAAAISKLVATTIAQTKELARLLYPVELEAHGLMAALEELMVSTTKLFRVKCSFACRQPVTTQNRTAASQLFRIAQETVRNAVRHGDPQRIRTTLSARNGTITLTVRDDGKGFARSAKGARGSGLRIMEHRARSIGATLAIVSRRGRGTTVTCRWAPTTGGSI